jgi:FtsH-binding integral membrane protein
MAKGTFAARHPWDNRFWLVFLATSWLAIAIGFWNPIAQRFFGQPDYDAPWALVIHVWTVFGWMVLLTIQALLVNQRRIDWHRKLGMAGALLAPFVAISGYLAEVFSQRYWALQDPENVRFFTFPIYTLIVFSVCALLAILTRRDPAAHKRLIFLATSAVMGGPYQRWWGGSIDSLTGTGPFNTWAHYYAGLVVLFVAAVIYDLATRGDLHRVFRIGIPVLLAGQVLANLVWHSHWWPPLVRRLLDIAPV